MKPHECEKEKLVIEAVRTGRWDRDLREHAVRCELCADVALAARALNEMRAADEVEARIPAAGLVWWKAQLLARRQAEERATQPINFVERFAYAWAALCAVGVGVWQWHVIRGWLLSVVGGAASLGPEPLWSFVSRASRNAVVDWSTANWPGKSAYIQGTGLIVSIGVGVLLVVVALAAYFTTSDESE